VLRTLGDLRIGTTIRDERCGGRPLAATFQGRLRPEQQRAAEALLAHDTGVLAATTAFGKTVIGAWLIAERRVSTLVLVHRRQLLDQWIERLAMFLGSPSEAIGRIGGGRRRPTGLIDVAVVQSLIRTGVVDDCVADYGHLIVDECHHLPARSFEQVARQAKARFVAGLSATVTRKDGHHPIVFMQCGPRPASRRRAHASRGPAIRAPGAGTAYGVPAAGCRKRTSAWSSGALSGADR
jgi:superfamily II DNA or RNA helicase